MDLDKLSCNWKTLRASLQADKENKKSQASVGKRKAGERSRDVKPLKRFKPGHRRNITLNGSEQGDINDIRMGAYVSSLPTASYGLAPKPQSREHVPLTSENDASLAPKLAKSYVALDCEMVGTQDLDAAPFSIRTHDSKERSVLARVSIVNYDLETIYDAYVIQPRGVGISDYRTKWSGITAEDLRPSNKVTKPKELNTVQKEVDDIIHGRVLVGHALKGDLGVLGLSHPGSMKRDTSQHIPFRLMAAGWQGRARSRRERGSGGKNIRGTTPALRRLAKNVLDWEIQDDPNGHDSIQDARAAMALYKIRRDEFEKLSNGQMSRMSLKAARDGSNEDEALTEPTKSGAKKRKKKKSGMGKKETAQHGLA